MGWAIPGGGSADAAAEVGYGAWLYDAVHRRRAGPGQESQAERAYRLLWVKIVDREIPPLARLRELDIAAEAQVSRSPVREAVARLVAEGLLQRDGRSLRVCVLEPEDVRDLYAYRAVLECHAARCAARVLSEEVLAEEAAALAACAAAVHAPSQRSITDWMRADLLLHDRVVQAAGSPRLAAALAQLRGILGIFQVNGFRSADNVRASLEEHVEIVAALRRRDADGAAAAMGQHLRSTCERVLRQELVYVRRPTASGRRADPRRGTGASVPSGSGE